MGTAQAARKQCDIRLQPEHPQVPRIRRCGNGWRYSFGRKQRAVRVLDLLQAPKGGEEVGASARATATGPDAERPLAREGQQRTWLLSIEAWSAAEYNPRSGGQCQSSSARLLHMQHATRSRGPSSNGGARGRGHEDRKVAGRVGRNCSTAAALAAS
jgi:hypothetical protein